MMKHLTKVAMTQLLFDKKLNEPTLALIHFFGSRKLPMLISMKSRINNLAKKNQGNRIIRGFCVKIPIIKISHAEPIS